MSNINFDKPIPKISIKEWFDNITKFSNEYTVIQNHAFNVRHEGRELCDTSAIETEWSLQKNNLQLSNRCNELSYWKEELSNYIRAIENEIQNMETEKSSMEREIRLLSNNFEMVNECLILRNEGKRLNMCSDDVEHQLHKELNKLGIIRQTLTNNCTEALQKIMELSKLLNNVKSDMQQKEEALNIEKDTLNIGELPLADIGYKPDIDLCISYTSYESWIKHCQNIKQEVSDELENSRRLRKGMYEPIERSRNDITSQNEATNFSFRKRIFEFHCALDELQWQKHNLNQESCYILNRISELEEALKTENMALKVAETQNINRIHRPGIELCQDKCTIGLQDQVYQFEHMKCDLYDKLTDLKKSHNLIQDQIHKLEEDILNKTHAVNIDVRCLEIRSSMLSSS